MKTYAVRLQSEVSKSYFATRAAQSLDIDTEKKSVHEFSVSADLESPFGIGLIVGASGSGKSTLARHIFGEFKTYLKKETAVIDQFPEEMSYDDRASALNGIGLSQVPCWIKPAACLSNGQQARAEAALAMAQHGGGNLVVIDEWTSVVDRTVAKAMSACVSKYAKRSGKSVVLLSCHYDVIEWLDPDWVIDCNSQTFTDRRSLRRERQEKLQFDIREITGRSWSRFAKYHYLSENLPGGERYFFGLFHGNEQIGFQCFANYVPKREGQLKTILHSNRTVIHPDYVGLGLGMKLIDETSKIMYRRGFKIMAKFSSTPVYRAMMKSKYWILKETKRDIGILERGCLSVARQKSFRTNVKSYSFEFVLRNE